VIDAQQLNLTKAGPTRLVSWKTARKNVRIEAGICEQKNLLYIVHGSDGSIGLGVLGKADEAETTTTTSVTILHDDLQ
jgi:hypothetical protein